MTGRPSNREMPNFDFGFDFDGIQERSREFVNSMKSIETNRKKDMCMKKLDDHKQKIGASYLYELWMMDNVWMDDVFEAKTTKLTML